MLGVSVHRSRDRQRDLGTVASETRRTLDAAGTPFERVVKVNIFMADLADFDGMNAVYREFFPTEPPARRTVRAGLVDGFKVEIGCVGGMSGQRATDRGEWP